MVANSLKVCLAVLAIGVGTGTQAAPSLAPGRRLAEQGRWGEAVDALESALERAPDDPHILCELGWAAFRAGDVGEARTVLERAIPLAKDPKLKAACLYSLGRVEDAYGRRATAGKLFRASLELRASRDVEEWAEREKGAKDEPPTPESLDEVVPCAEPRPLDEIRECMETENGELSWEVLEREPLPGFRVLVGKKLGLGPENSVFLLGRAGDKWAVVTELGSNSDEYYVGTEVGVVMSGERRVLRFEASWEWHRFGGRTGTAYGETKATVCVEGQTPAATRCLLRIPLEKHDADYAAEHPEAFTGEYRVEEESRMILRVDVGPDGLAQVILVKGAAPADSGILGLHRLW